MFFVDRLAKSGTLEAPSAAWVENYSIRKKKGRTGIRTELDRFLVRAMTSNHSTCDILALFATHCRDNLWGLVKRFWNQRVEIQSISAFWVLRDLARKMQSTGKRTPGPTHFDTCSGHH